MPTKTTSTPLLKDGSFNLEKVVDLNFFDLTGAKAKTKGSSNKQYTAELHYEKNGSRAQIYTMWGPTGGSQTKDWRHYDSKDKAAKEFESIIKSKKRKGYKEIDVAQRAYGSDEAKKIVKAVVLNNVEPTTTKTNNQLHPETSRIISTLMGSTNSFVIQTLKCPLGQLTNNQIQEGRNCLNQAKKIVEQQNLKKSDLDELERITNDFYGLIPHNLGSGARGQMTHLLLDTKDKIDKKEYDLDTLLDAKAIGATLTSTSTYDQYLSLETTFNYIERNDSIFSWLNDMIQKTRASNHAYLGKIVLLNAWDIQRSGERDVFLKTANKIAGECGKSVIPNQLKDLVKERKDVDNESLYKKANILPLFHGTRTQNITGILKQGLIIRPSGVVINGSMYGSGAVYFGFGSKSANYTSIKSSYWAKGSDDRGFLFITDCALGSQLVAKGPYQYTESNIKPHHSVWAKGGVSGVINDEFMLYRTDQHSFRYLLEFTCQRN
jgi:poly [ADP-ribose] polymerase 2/3/4